MFFNHNKLKYLSIYLNIGFLTLFIFLLEVRLVDSLPVEAAELSRDISPLAQIKLARDYLNSGQLTRAIKQLEKLVPILKNQGRLEYTARFYLGNAYLLQGKYPEAIDNYLASGELAVDAPASVAVLNNLFLAYYRQGKLQQKEEVLKAARQYARQAVETSANVSPGLSSVRAWLNWQKISGNSAPADYQQQLEIVLSLPPSSNKARLLVEMADYTTNEKITTLQKAVATAQETKDLRTLSWALGTLGAWAENQGLFSVALEHTQKAQLAAQEILATDIIYRWQWQLGRIHLALGESELAQLAYGEAISSLELIKEDLLIEIRNKQINFAEEVEPIYRQYLKLLLSEAESERAWIVGELLAKSELETYFGNNCFVLDEKVRSKPDNVAVIRSIIFEETTYLMVKSGEEITVFPIKIAAKDLESLISQWRYQLELPIDNTYRIIGEQLYELLIKPIEPNLVRVERLIFINDGLLRTVPMAALYDGQKHLIEQYPISYAISSEIEINKVRSRDKLLALGLSEFRNNLPALPQVKRELLAIEQISGGDFLLDEDFTTNKLVEELERGEYSILHLATHGSFGGSSENIYLQAYDRSISLSELEQILLDDRFTLQLLVLSGCETAIGNEDALLGLAGIGIRTGVATTIGSMWSVNSASTVDLFADFYLFYWSKKMDSSSALRSAQLKFVGEQIHPYYWSAFINIY